MRSRTPFRPRLAAGLLLLLSAVSPGQPAPAPEATPAVRSPGNAEWAVTLAEARRRADSQQKLLFVEFGQKACGNCQRMDTLLYPAFEFEALLLPMVPIKLDLDAGEGKTLASRYNVREAPSLLITTPEGRLVFLMQGFQNAPDFYTHVRQDLDSYRRFARKVEAQRVGELPAGEALDTGRELFQRTDTAAALPRLERVGKATDAKPEMREEALELAAAAELDLGRPEASRKTIEKLITTTRDSDRKERAELFQAQIPLSENKPAEALELYRDFRKAHPQSRYAARVDEMIQMLEGARPR
ncbi:MAG: hypothetical protein ACRD3M_16900 [Thermoanaerobaculia bacterium]